MISARELLTASPLAPTACPRSDELYFGNARPRKTQAAAWFGKASPNQSILLCRTACRIAWRLPN